ncbi:autocrine proliferation repressor protein A [Aplysia californica]|uniref:Autocrine proliferation repressor protein A n=1 Tax=Aplysia californica TaxID=6500 RepID=A0ABM1W2A8_APLCA|nr:autocrine proliferation repressor protein A [Aplysia californica]
MFLSTQVMDEYPAFDVKETTTPVWWHYMIVAVPDVVHNTNTSFIYLSDGDNLDLHYKPYPGDSFYDFVTMMAVTTGTVCVNLRNIPYAPVVFQDDPARANKTEDEIIAWTWWEFVSNRSDNPEWLLRLPMTKNAHHHFRSLGGWTFAFRDYYHMNFTDRLDDPRTKLMADIVDPFFRFPYGEVVWVCLFFQSSIAYSVCLLGHCILIISYFLSPLAAYRDLLTMPKYIITTGGDEFFIIDDSYYYLKDIPGENLLRTLANAEHLLILHRVSLFMGVRSFYMSVFQGNTSGELTMTCDTEPIAVVAEYAKTISKTRRDFRLFIADPVNPEKPFPQPVFWFKQNVQKLGNNRYSVIFDNPPEGWLAFHIHATFPGPDDSVFEFTTENMIIPNYLPFPDCHNDTCTGTLV